MFMFPVTLLSERVSIAEGIVGLFPWGGQRARPQGLCGEHGAVFDQTLGMISQDQSALRAGSWDRTSRVE